MAMEKATRFALDHDLRQPPGIGQPLTTGGQAYGLEGFAEYPER